MIALQCSKCQHKLEVDDALAGRQTRCPECQTVNQVPYPDFYAFRCPNPECQRELEVSADSMGQMIKCPHCGTSTFVPGKGVGQASGCLGMTSVIAFLMVAAGTFLTLVLIR